MPNSLNFYILVQEDTGLDRQLCYRKLKKARETNRKQQFGKSEVSLLS